MTTTGFQRARRPDQIEARRDAILSGARALLTGAPLTEVTLTSLAAHVGIAKSNVLRYFDSREAVFLVLLDEEWAEWIAAIEAKLDALPKRKKPTRSERIARARKISRIVARETVARPLLCELVCALGSVLEHNVGLEIARDFKKRTFAHSDRAAAALRRAAPELSGSAADEFAGATIALITGMWSFAHPTAQLAQVHVELGQPAFHELFPRALEHSLAALLVGLGELDH